MVEQRDIDIIFDNPIDWEKFRDKTILVTGATGRLGMYIVDALIKADVDWNLNLRVIALARDKSKLQRLFGRMLQLPNISVAIQDINDPISYDQDVDCIFHTAGAASPKDFTETPVDTLWGHINGTHNVLEFAKVHNTQRLLYVSTVEVYGEWQNQDNIRETVTGEL